MFCMVFLLCLVQGTIPSTRPGRSLSGDVRTGDEGDRKPPRARGGAGSPGTGQHGPDRSGVAGRRPNRLRGLSVEEEVPQQTTGGEEPKQTSSADLIRQCLAQVEPPWRGESITAPTQAPCPAALLKRDPCTTNAVVLDEPEQLMPDFNLSVLSLADLRDLQKSVAKAISTFEVRQKAEGPRKGRDTCQGTRLHLGRTGGTRGTEAQTGALDEDLLASREPDPHLIRTGTQAGLVRPTCRCK